MLHILDIIVLFYTYFSPSAALFCTTALASLPRWCSVQTSEWEHVNSTPRGSAHNAYHSDLNSVTTDNFTNSWGSIKAHLKYATCHFYIRKHAVQNGTFSLVFVIILQAKLVSSWGLKCQMIYSSPHCHLHSAELRWMGGGKGWDLL